MSSEFSEFYNGVLAQEKPLFILREKCRDLAKEFPYLANTNRNTCTIPTPAIVFRDTPEVYGRNFENYKGRSSFGLFHRDPTSIKLGRIERLLSGREDKEIPELTIITIETQFSEKKSIYLSLHFYGWEKGVPEHIYYDTRKPNFRWKNGCLRGKILGAVTAEDINVFMNAAQKAEDFLKETKGLR